MGFGYYRINMDRLGIVDLPSGISMGTKIGLGNQERASIDTNYKGKISLQEGDCMTFVREFIKWSS